MGQISVDHVPLSSHSQCRPMAMDAICCAVRQGGVSCAGANNGGLRMSPSTLQSQKFGFRVDLLLFSSPNPVILYIQGNTDWK